MIVKTCGLLEVIMIKSVLTDKPQGGFFLYLPTFV